MAGTKIGVTREVAEYRKKHWGRSNLPKDENGKCISRLPRDENGKILPGPGNPHSYCPLIGYVICDRVASGESILSVARDIGLKESRIWGWGDEDGGKGSVAEFAEDFRQARKYYADHLAHETIEIADERSNDSYIVRSRSGNEYERTNREVVDRSKLRVGARQWLAGKLNPRKYADKQQLEITGSVDLVAMMDDGRRRAAAAIQQLEPGPRVLEVEKPVEPDPEPDVVDVMPWE